ncbi:uncharacterized protein LOC121637659 isoform X2 [Melanotaenia boesemani]|nr:uncharacterized protein LOC121637659 isoform X2 [Melanotaenia boesemani]
MPGEMPSECLPPTPSFSTPDELRESLKHIHLPVSSLLFKCVNAAQGGVAEQPSPCAIHDVHDGTNTCQTCMSFYDSFVDIGFKKCADLEHATLEQSACHLWHDSRRLRITASTAKKVPIRGKPQTFIREHLFPRFHGNAATHHGLQGETSACQWLEAHGFAVSHRGTVVCVNEPWLSASPDGVLNSEELLEIKCPLLKSEESLEDLILSQRYDVKMVEGTPELQQKGPRGFYMQVQLGMLCTGLRACKLLIWSPSQQVLLHVPYNEQFCNTTVARLKAFYFKHMLPHMSDEFRAGRLLLSSTYMQLCKE